MRIMTATLVLIVACIGPAAAVGQVPFPELLGTDSSGAHEAPLMERGRTRAPIPDGETLKDVIERLEDVGRSRRKGRPGSSVSDFYRDLVQYMDGRTATEATHRAGANGEPPPSGVEPTDADISDAGLAGEIYELMELRRQADSLSALVPEPTVDSVARGSAPALTPRRIEPVEVGARRYHTAVDGPYPLTEYRHRFERIRDRLERLLVRAISEDPFSAGERDAWVAELREIAMDLNAVADELEARRPVPERR